MVFDPFDMSVIEVRWNGVLSAWPSRSTSAATPTPRPGPSTCRPARATGIDYLAVIAAEHKAARAQRIRYDALGTGTQPAAGQETAEPEARK